MADLLLPFIVLTLIVVIIVQAVERYVFAAQAQQMQRELTTAILSRNATEYATAIKVEKQPATPQIESDDVELSQASDEVFDKFINT